MAEQQARPAVEKELDAMEQDSKGEYSGDNKQQAGEDRERQKQNQEEQVDEMKK